MGCCGNGIGRWIQTPQALPKLNAMTAQKVALEGGKPAADLGLIERRIALCRKCVYYDAAQERCNRCTCVLVGKVGKSRESCPTGCW